MAVLHMFKYLDLSPTSQQWRDNRLSCLFISTNPVFPCPCFSITLEGRHLASSASWTLIKFSHCRDPVQSQCSVVIPVCFHEAKSCSATHPVSPPPPPENTFDRGVSIHACKLGLKTRLHQQRDPSWDFQHLRKSCTCHQGRQRREGP